jgi:hypothetical protein
MEGGQVRSLHWGSPRLFWHLATSPLLLDYYTQRPSSQHGSQASIQQDVLAVIKAVPAPLAVTPGAYLDTYARQLPS